jgi:hypothetical protein
MVPLLETNFTVHCIHCMRVATLKEVMTSDFFQMFQYLLSKHHLHLPPPPPTYFYRNVSVFRINPFSVFYSLKKQLKKLRFWVDEDVTASMVPWIQR